MKADHFEEGHVVGHDISVAHCHPGRCRAASPPLPVDLDEDAGVEREKGEAEDEVDSEEGGAGA